MLQLVTLLANRFRLLPSERMLLGFVALVAVLAVLQVAVKGLQVVWLPFIAGYAATTGLAIVGAYIRQSKGAPRLAMGLVGFAIYAGFIAVSPVFIFSLLPLGRPLVDLHLIGIDRALGYSWPGLVAWLSEHPLLGQTLGYVYLSSQHQLIFTIILLSVMARYTDLQRFLAVGIFALVISVAVWYSMPSVGPSAFLDIPIDQVVAIGLHYTPEIGAIWRDLVENGPDVISPEIVTGVIAFPSYHIIMSAMVVWFTRATPVFMPMLLLNVAMIPAALSHGAHHLIDLLGGGVIFIFAVYITNHLIRAEPRP